MPSEDSAPVCARGARDGVHDADLERVELVLSLEGHADLTRLVETWPALPEAVRKQVLDLIDGAVNTTEASRLPRRGFCTPTQQGSATTDGTDGTDVERGKPRVKATSVASSDRRPTDVGPTATDGRG